MDSIATLNFFKVSMMSARLVRTLVQCETQCSGPPDLKPSSKASLPFAWIADLRNRAQLNCMVIAVFKHLKKLGFRVNLKLFGKTLS